MCDCWLYSSCLLLHSSTDSQVIHTKHQDSNCFLHKRLECCTSLNRSLCGIIRIHDNVKNVTLKVNIRVTAYDIYYHINSKHISRYFNVCVGALCNHLHLCTAVHTLCAHTDTDTHKVDKEEQWNSNWRLEVKY